jgi:hypothetical protein
MESTSPTLEVVVTQAAEYANAGQALTVKAEESLQQLGALVAKAAAPMGQAIFKDEAAPNEVEVTLQLALKGESKWLVVTAVGEAAVTIKLSWVKK